MKVAIIGAGWAGAAAAWTAHKLGYQTVVFEAAPIAGGRARKHHSKALGQTIDNGQHLLIGAYEQTLALMQELGINTDKAFHRFDLHLESLAGDVQLHAAPLPAPWHLASAILFAKGVSWSERLAIVRLQRYLQKKHWHIESGQTVAQLLAASAQPSRLINYLWEPLCVGALNTPINQACAQLFANVLRDSLDRGRSASQMLIPLNNMSDLWLSKALAPVDLRLRHPVRQLTLQSDHSIEINNERFDYVIIATTAPSAYRLLQPLATDQTKQAWLEPLTTFEYSPIATLYLQPQSAWQTPDPLYMLTEDPNSLAAGQWVFNHAKIDSELQNTIAVTTSCASRLLEGDKQDITNAVIRQLNAQSRWPLPAIVSSELIIEKRATFLARPKLKRPTTHSPWARIRLAGDWLANPYPAVLEGAVQSGITAAQSIKP